MKIETIAEGVWFKDETANCRYFFETPKPDNTQIVEINYRHSFLYVPFTDLNQALEGLRMIQWEPGKQEPVNLDVKNGGTFFVDYPFGGEQIDNQPWHSMQVGYLQGEFQAGHNLKTPEELQTFAELTVAIVQYFEEHDNRFPGKA